MKTITKPPQKPPYTLQKSYNLLESDISQHIEYLENPTIYARNMPSHQVATFKEQLGNMRLMYNIDYQSAVSSSGSISVVRSVINRYRAKLNTVLSLWLN